MVDLTTITAYCTKCQQHKTMLRSCYSFSPLADQPGTQWQCRDFSIMEETVICADKNII